MLGWIVRCDILEVVAIDQGQMVTTDLRNHGGRRLTSTNPVERASKADTRYREVAW
jgi:hypothetical protein